jgi:hypothetical protein
MAAVQLELWLRALITTNHNNNNNNNYMAVMRIFYGYNFDETDYICRGHSRS